MLNAEPIDFVLVGIRLLHQSRKALNRITTLAILYHIDGNHKWAERAIKEMRAAAAFEYWNPLHFLDVAEMTAALALGYDWLYDVLTPDDRVLIKDAIVQKGLEPGLSCYQQSEWWTKHSCNWNNVCAGGLIVGALAVADEEPEIAEEILSHTLRNLPIALATYAPDGAWPEGMAYWAYATEYTLFAAYALHSSLGTDLGLMDKPGMRQAGYFPYALTGPTGKIFNFSDCGTVSNPCIWQYGLAKWYKDPSCAYLARELKYDCNFSQQEQKFSSLLEDYLSVFNLIWFDPSGSPEDIASLPLDNHFVSNGVAAFRSSWTDKDAIFVGFKAGDNKVTHSHLDLGSFVLEADHVRWADDLGSDDYNLFDYWGDTRWTYYRTMTCGHNTLTLDGKNQDPKAAASMKKFVSNEKEAFAIADLTAAYAPSGAEQVRRGIRLFEGRKRVLIQDEVETQTPVEVVWSMHTQAEVSIEANGSLVTLTIGEKTLRVQLLSPSDARFSVEEVTLEAPQSPLENTRKLMVRLPEKTTSTRIAVVFSPRDQSLAAPEVIPLAQWK